MITTVLMALLLVNALLLGLGLWRLRALRRMTALLDQELGILRQVPFDEAPDLERLLGSGERPLIVMDILNPMQVAAKQSWFADRFGAMAPALIRRIVYQEAVKRSYEELARHGVEAQVKLHRGA